MAAPTSIHVYTLILNGSFQQRVSLLLAATAIAVLGEAPSVEHHAARASYSVRVLDRWRDEGTRAALVWGAYNRVTLAKVTDLDEISDASIEAGLSAIFNHLSGVITVA